MNTYYPQNRKIKFLKKLSFRTVLLLLLFAQACKNDEVFVKEQYKNVFALISESDNVSKKFHELGEESIGYIAASLGGTNPIDKEILVNLVEDPQLINDYNRINFDTDVSKYVRQLPSTKYTIANYSFSIPANTISGRLPIEIRPDGLSPDSSYFIALRVTSFSTYEVNPTKSFILYQVKTKNQWAQADGNTVYNMRGKYRIQGTPNELEMPGTKVMHPLTKNSVRFMAGSETYASDINVFNKSAIVATILEGNKVKITSYKNMLVTQVDGDPEYPNIFKIEDDGFKTYKTFLLRYNFVSGNTTYEMKEELRLEFKEEEEKN